MGYSVHPSMVPREIAQKAADQIRTHLERNSWRTVELKEFRSVFGITNNAFNAGLAVLKEQGFPVKQAAHGKYRYEPQKERKPVEHLEPEPVVDTPPPEEVKPELPPEPGPNATIYDQVAYTLATLSDPTEGIKSRDLEALVLGDDTGVSGIKHVNQAVNRLLLQNKIYRRRDMSLNKKGVRFKYFWGPDPNPAEAPVYAKNRALVALAQRSSQPPPPEPPPEPPPQPISAIRPAPPEERHLPETFSPKAAPQESAYLRGIRERVAELEQLLSSVEPLQREYDHLRQVLAIYDRHPEVSQP